VLGELPIGCIEVGLIAAGTGDGGPEIIRDSDFWDSSEEAKRMDMGLNPRGKILGESGLSKGVIACSQSCHKDLHFGDDTGGGIHDRHRLSGIVYKEFFSRPIFLTERRIDSLSPLAIQSAELTILVTIGMGLLILVPKKLKGYALPLQFLVKILHGRHVAFFFSNTKQRRKKKTLQRGFIHFWSKRPGYTGPGNSTKVILDRASCNGKAFGDLPGRETVFMM